MTGRAIIAACISRSQALTNRLGPENLPYTRTIWRELDSRLSSTAGEASCLSGHGDGGCRTVGYPDTCSWETSAGSTTVPSRRTGISLKTNGRTRTRPYNIENASPKQTRLPRRGETAAKTDHGNVNCAKAVSGRVAG